MSLNKVSTGLSLTTDHIMRNFYRDNRKAIGKNDRSSFSKIELSYEDSRALSHAAKRLIATDYGSTKGKDKDSDIDETTKNTIEAFVNTYNNALETGSTSDHDTKRYLRQLKGLTQKYKDELKDIGISVEKDGKLSINDGLLSMADSSKVRKLFSSENEFSKKTLSISKKLNGAIQNNIFSQVTGNGLHINITM